jgi:hypothetical protein
MPEMEMEGLQLKASPGKKVSDILPQTNKLGMVVYSVITAMWEAE